MGYCMAVGVCIQCKRTFGFNPHKVPSVRVNGVREPVCEACITTINVMRKAMGLEPHPVNPEAYNPIHESEL